MHYVSTGGGESVFVCRMMFFYCYGAFFGADALEGFLLAQRVEMPKYGVPKHM